MSTSETDRRAVKARSTYESGAIGELAVVLADVALFVAKILSMIRE